ncbi:MAG: glycosyltransferase [bacterium]
MTETDSFHILQVVASLHGGAAQHVLLLSRGLQKQGFRVTVAAPADYQNLVQHFSQHEIPVAEHPLHLKNPLPAILSLRKFISAGNFSHVHVHGHRAAFVTRLAQILHNTVPLIYTVHGYHPPFYTNPCSRLIVNLLEKLLARWTDTFICVSESTRSLLTAAVPSSRNKNVVIGNAVESYSLNTQEKQNLRRQIRAEFSLPMTGVVIGTVARLQWQKGIDRLLKAFALLSPDIPELYLLLVGDGPEQAALQALSQELAVQYKVRFAGARHDVRNFYHAMDVFVLPSLWEGMPLTILEAWDSEVPVIATNVPGSRELIDHAENGLLAENSTGGLAQTLKIWLSQPDSWKHLLRNGKNSILQEHSLDRMIAQTIRLYQNLKNQ